MYADFSLGLSAIKPGKSTIKSSGIAELERIKVLYDDFYFQTLLLNDTFHSLILEFNDENKSAFGLVIHDCLYCLLRLRSALPNNCNIKTLHSLLLCLVNRLGQLQRNDGRIVDYILSKVDILNNSIK